MNDFGKHFLYEFMIITYKLPVYLVTSIVHFNLVLSKSKL